MMPRSALSELATCTTLAPSRLWMGCTPSPSRAPYLCWRDQSTVVAHQLPGCHKFGAHISHLVASRALPRPAISAGCILLTSPIDNPRSCEMGCAVARSEVAPPLLFVPIPGVCKKVVTSENFSSCSKFSRLAGTNLTRELGYTGMTDENLNPTTLDQTSIEPSPSNNEDVQRHWHRVAKRRSFFRSIGIAGTALSARAYERGLEQDIQAFEEWQRT